MLARAVSALLVCLLWVAAPGCDKAQSDSIRLSNQGMKALGASQIRTAKLRFTEAITVNADNANAHYGLGVCYLELSQPERAAQHLAEAVRLKPALTEANFHLGSIAFQSKHLDEAETKLRLVLENEAEHSAAHDLMGRIHEQRGELKEAEVAFRRAIQLDAYQPTTFLSLARLYLRVEAEDAAEAVLREGLRHNTINTTRSSAELSLLHNELGIMLQQAGNYATAVDELLQAVRLPGARPEVVFNLGWAYASRGDAEMALKYFNQYVALVDNHDPMATVALDVTRHLSHRIKRAAN
ncbi:MAG: Flp pilus assembly protein TadD [Myxococcota bacterium]|jgi:Flp pilus assembly protein TadD